MHPFPSAPTTVRLRPLNTMHPPQSSRHPQPTSPSSVPTVHPAPTSIAALPAWPLSAHPLAALPSVRPPPSPTPTPPVGSLAAAAHRDIMGDSLHPHALSPPAERFVSPVSGAAIPQRYTQPPTQMMQARPTAPTQTTRAPAAGSIPLGTMQTLNQAYPQSLPSHAATMPSVPPALYAPSIPPMSRPMPRVPAMRAQAPPFAADLIHPYYNRPADAGLANRSAGMSMNVQSMPMQSMPMHSVYPQPVYTQRGAASAIRPLPPGPPHPMQPHHTQVRSQVSHQVSILPRAHAQKLQPRPPVQALPEAPPQARVPVPAPDRVQNVPARTAPISQVSAPVPPATVPRDAATEHYWRRLHAMLTSASKFAGELQPDRTALPRPEDTHRQIAYDLQGLFAHTADAHAAKQTQQYRSAYSARAAGDFMEYGVASAHAVWAAAILAEIVGFPTPRVYDAPLMNTSPDRAVEGVRLSLFEAEVSCLPMEFVEELLKKRRAMRKFKHRIDLCVRILLALEGRGRRPTQATVDRVKLQLEKADMQARAEAEREAARKEREQLKNDRAKRTGVKAEDHKKRKRQQSAQANFMMKFVKKEEKAEVEAEEVVVVEPREGSAVPLAKDGDVMTVSWWLRAEMKNVSMEQLDGVLSGQQGENVSVKHMIQHLTECAERRKSAQRRIHVVLREFRQHRKMHIENRTPMFAARRADVRGKGITGPVKLLQFAENHRPAFFGTFSQRSKLISGRRPLGKDCELNYECDSADEWDEDEEGEDLLDVEADKELASEEAELRKLYGSDDEDDDDFLDDADVDDDDHDDRDGDENNNTSGAISEEGPAAPKADGECTDVVDLTLTTVNDSKSDHKRTAKDDHRRRSGKRRKGLLKQSVVTYDVSIPDGEPSVLDRFAVNTFKGSQPIQMFNPFVYTSSDIVAEHLKAKPPSSRAVRASNMDESAKLDLAAALMQAGSTKDKIVIQFCEHRKLRGLAVPTKADINRAIGEIATKEKRNGDARALWHLTDQSIAKKIAGMKNSRNPPFPRPSASVVVD